MTDIRPFRIDIPQGDLDDLQARLSRTRFADSLPTDAEQPDLPPGAQRPAGWQFGVPTDYVRDLVGYWRDGYDWRVWEARINAHPQFTDHCFTGEYPTRLRDREGPPAQKQLSFLAEVG